jgi:uncharacterized membrane protein YhaH (DUF805 family)
MIEYIKHAFKNTFNFRDRANRSEYWFYYIVIAIVAIILSVLVGIFCYKAYEEALEAARQYGYRLDEIVITVIKAKVQFYICYLILPILSALSFALLVRRLHDINLSEWFSLLGFVPFINGIFYIVIGCLPGKTYPNKYGERPFEVPKVPRNAYGPGYGQPPYGGQQPPYGGQQPPYGGQQHPYTGPQPPQYGAPQPPQPGAPQPPQQGATPPQPSPGPTGPASNPPRGSTDLQKK